MDLIEHLLGGFYFFLQRNLRDVSWDFSTCAGGLVALVLATLVIHRFATQCAAKSQRFWNLRSTLCLVMLIPILFCIAFIIPGLLLQWELLRS